MTRDSAALRADNPELAPNIYLARQAIYNDKLAVVAYELLFRDSTTNAANIRDGNLATSTLITNIFVEMGLEAITDGKTAFINLTRDFLTGQIPLPFKPENIVLEILEDISADAQSLAGARALDDQGYTLALDDFILSKDNQDLIQFTDIIKIDIRAFDQAGLKQAVENLAQFPVKLLAEKVETGEEYTYCKELGFALYQGYFFSRPAIISRKQLPSNMLVQLEILAKLQSPDCSLQEIEEMISFDIGISFKLLNIINSSYYNLNKKVESISHALAMLGLKTLKSWISVITLANVQTKSAELTSITLTRAKMCEELSASFHCSRDAAFIVGMFSMLDALMDMPLESLLGNLPLSEEIVAALLRQEGPLGALLTYVTCYENGQLHDYGSPPLTEATALDAYLLALDWNKKITGQLH